MSGVTGKIFQTTPVYQKNFTEKAHFYCAHSSNMNIKSSPQSSKLACFTESGFTGALHITQHDDQEQHNLKLQWKYFTIRGSHTWVMIQVLLLLTLSKDQITFMDSLINWGWKHSVSNSHSVRFWDGKCGWMIAFTITGHRDLSCRGTLSSGLQNYIYDISLQLTLA